MDRPVYSSGSKATKIAKVTKEWDNSLLLQRVGKFQRSSFCEIDWFYYFLNTHLFRQHLISNQNGTQDGKDLPHVSAKTVNSCPVPLAPYKEQCQIVKKIKRFSNQNVISLSQRINKYRQDIEKLDQCIYLNAFSGMMVPQDPRDEPASILLERIRQEKTRLSSEEVKPRKREKKTNKSKSTKI